MSLNKIHVNNSTNISLNDRFTIIQNVGPQNVGVPTTIKTRRNSARSQSGGRENAKVKGSAKNMELVRQLEKRHKIVAALKLKKKSVRRNIAQRQFPNRNNLNRSAYRFDPKSLSVSPAGKLRRTNSLTTLATMNADIIQKRPLTRLRRRNSVSNITERLGYRQTVNNGTNQRRKFVRNNFTNIKRSNSRSNLSRSNSKTNLRRANSNNSLNLRTNNNARGRSRSRSRSNIRKRSNSVNSRLGVNRTSKPLYRNVDTKTRGIRGGFRRGVIRGRIFRRSTQQQNSGANIDNQTRRGRPRTRSLSANGRTPSGNRNRSRSRSRPNAGINKRGQPRNTRGIRGKRGSRGKRGGSFNNKSAQVQPVKSKEELDKELEQYMATTKSTLDHEMDEYMKGAQY